MESIERARSLAFRVCLQHWLSAAQRFEEDLNDEREIQGVFSISSATRNWIDRLEDALVVCGVYGLVAVSRAEDCLLLRLKLNSSCGKYQTARRTETMFVRDFASQLYAQALFHQKYGDDMITNLWEVAGSCADRVALLQPTPSEKDTNPYEGASKALRMLSDRDECIEGGRDCAEGEGPIPRNLAGLYRRAAMGYGRVSAYEYINLIQRRYCKAFVGVDLSTISLRLEDVVRALESAAEYMRKAAEYGHSAYREQDAEVSGLWRRASDMMQQAAVTTEDLLAEREDVRRAHTTARHAKVLDSLATALSPVADRYDDETIYIRDSAGTAYLEETGRLLSEVYQEVQRSFVYQAAGADAEGEVDADEDRWWLVEMEERRLLALVEAVDHRLTGAGTRAGRDQETVDWYTEQARKVDKGLSPAHSHIAHCWDRAAHHLSSIAGITAEVRFEITGPHGCYRLNWEQVLRIVSDKFAQLAEGAFSQAAEYFAEAEQAATPAARALWAEAAEAMVGAGLEHARVLEACVTGRHYNDAQVRESTPLGEALEQLALRCAEAAGCCELPEDSADKVLTAAAADLERAAVSYYDQPGSKFGEATKYISAVRMLFDDASVLLKTPLEEGLQAFLPHPVLEDSYVTPYDQQRLREGAVWLCDVAVACTSIIRQHVWRGERIIRSNSLDQVFRCCRLSRMKIFCPYAAIAEEGGYDSDMARICSSRMGHCQVACNRYLKAAELDTAVDMKLEHDMWALAAERAMQAARSRDALETFYSEVGDRMVRSVWAALGGNVEVPAQLLANAVPSGEPYQYASYVEAVATAEAGILKHRLASAQKENRAPPFSLHSSAQQQFELALRFGEQAAIDVVTSGVSLPACTEEAQRALLSAQRYASAASATRSTVAQLYERAADLTACNDGSVDDLSRRTPEVMAVADKAGQRYELAARTLEAGDHALHKRWQRAAEATSALLLVSKTGSVLAGNQRRTVRLAPGYSEQRLAEADALAEEAARSSALAMGTPSAEGSSRGKRKRGANLS